jgi:hypothetical protein
MRGPWWTQLSGSGVRHQALPERCWILSRAAAQTINPRDVCIALMDCHSMPGTLALLAQHGGNEGSTNLKGSEGWKCAWLLIVENLVVEKNMSGNSPTYPCEGLATQEGTSPNWRFRETFCRPRIAGLKNLHVTTRQSRCSWQFVASNYRHLQNGPITTSFS